MIRAFTDFEAMLSCKCQMLILHTAFSYHVTTAKWSYQTWQISMLGFKLAKVVAGCLYLVKVVENPSYCLTSLQMKEEIVALFCSKLISFRVIQNEPVFSRFSNSVFSAESNTPPQNVWDERPNSSRSESTN